MILSYHFLNYQASSKIITKYVENYIELIYTHVKLNIVRGKSFYPNYAGHAGVFDYSLCFSKQ